MAENEPQDLNAPNEPQDLNAPNEAAAPKEPQAKEMVKITTRDGQVFDVPKDVQEFYGKTIAHERNVAQDKHKAQLEDWKQTNQNDVAIQAEMSKKIQALEDEKLSTEAFAKVTIEREQVAAKEAQDKESQRANTNFDLYRNHKMENDLMGAVGKHDTNDAQASALLLKNAGNAQFVLDESTGNFNTLLSLPDEHGDIKTMTPVKAAEIYFNDPNNAYQLKVNLQAGSGSKAHGKQLGNGKTQYTRTDLQDSSVLKEYNEKRSADPSSVAIV